MANDVWLIAQLVVLAIWLVVTGLLLRARIAGRPSRGLWRSWLAATIAAVALSLTWRL